MKFSNRFELIHLLGGKCSNCPQENMSELEVDHIYNDGDLDRASFNNVYKKWLGMPELAKKRLQVLCKSCHDEKDWQVRQKEHDKFMSEIVRKDTPNPNRPKYELTRKSIDGTIYVVHRETEVIPFKLRCTCEASNFSIYAIKETSTTYLFCNSCEFTRVISISNQSKMIERFETA